MKILYNACDGIVDTDAFLEKYTSTNACEFSVAQQALSDTQRACLL